MAIATPQIPSVYMFGQEADTGHAWVDIRKVTSAYYDPGCMLYRLRFGPYESEKNVYKLELMKDGGRVIIRRDQFCIPVNNIYEICISQNLLNTKLEKRAEAIFRMYDAHHIEPVEKKKPKIYYNGAYNAFLKGLDNEKT